LSHGWKSTSRVRSVPTAGAAYGAAGVGPAWTFYTHGEIDPGVAEYLLQREAGPGGLLEKLGIDGLLVDRALTLAPQPASAWRLAHEEEEGRVYERTGAPIGPLHAIDVPNEKSPAVTIRLVSDGRQKVVAEVAVGAGEGSVVLVFARPFFDGYRATLDGQKIAVESYRGFAPLIRLPAGAHGRLTLIYRPWWLIAGGALAGFSLLAMLVAAGFALRTNS